MADGVYDAVLGALTLKQVSNTTYSEGKTVIAATKSGDVDPAQYYANRAEPKATFESTDIAGVLGGISVTAGLSISSGTITIPYRKRAQGATFAGSSAHVALSGTNGLLIPTSFSSSQDQEASTVSLELWFRSTDGATDPVTSATGASLASQSFNVSYDHGPVLVNASEVAEVTGFTVNPGIEVRAKRYQGLPFPTALYIVQRRPTIDLEFEDFDDAEAFVGTVTAMSSCACYMRKLADGSSHVAEATAEHVKFSFTDGIVTLETLSASGTEDGTATVRLYGDTLAASATNAIP